jgi:hypothetical protein
MSVVVEFKEVGRGKVSWEELLPAPDEALILRSIRNKKALMSHGVDVEISEDGKCGTIFVGGFRTVGKFEIVQP